MKLARFIDATQTVRYGLVKDDRILPLEATPPGGMEDWLGLRPGTMETLGARALRSKLSLPLNAVRLLAPVPRPRKFLGLGGNYASHLREIEHLGIKPPEVQIWFNKQTSCIAGPFDDIVIPAQSGFVDYEGELGVVIGRRCRHVPIHRANEVIAGFVVCNDVSVRDVQLKAATMTLGKSFDTHGPIGPWLVTADEIPDPQRLRVRTWVNGELRQDGNTSEMRYTVFDQIAALSSVFTLEPGDILATGTPAGVAAAMRPPRYLQAGDRVKIQIDHVGAIENRFVAEDPQTVIE